jgi:hypothetical protein
MNIREQVVYGVDIGLSGGIAGADFTIPMPVTRYEIKPVVLVLDLDSNKRKQYVKSGPNKGKVKYKQKTAAKYETKLDIYKLTEVFNNADIVAIEAQGTSFGNSAKSTRTTAFNAGIIHAVATLSGAEVVYVAANKWKKDLGVSKDKLECVELAEFLTGMSFRTKRNRLLDGEAEAMLIRHWYITTQTKGD